MVNSLKFALMTFFIYLLLFFFAFQFLEGGGQAHWAPWTRACTIIYYLEEINKSTESIILQMFIRICKNFIWENNIIEYPGLETNVTCIA